MRSLISAALFTVSAAHAATITVNANAGRHPISPLIYGVAFASEADLKALNAPLNRSGGNNTSTYNWLANAQNLDNDYYYESYPQPGGATAGASVDSFITANKAAAATSAITIPLIGYVAKLGPNRSILPSFSVAKYGAQCSVDPYDTDAGDGLHTDCSTPITGNNPLDAYITDTPTAEQAWVQHIVATFGPAKTGVAYYLMDNEPSIWFGTHADIHPVGPHATEYAQDVIAMAAKVKAVDKTAKVMAPEEWGWEGYFYSGYDQQYAAAHGYCCFPDHAGIQGGLDYIPWLLTQWKAAGHPVDVLSVHFYPQGAEFSNDDSAATQALRNRSTRQLWDTKYVSESWIGAPVYLIPRLKTWIKSYYYAGTPVAITEYNWGDEPHINGATTQADLYGIFGKYALNMATRWTVPANTTPTYKAMQMYRNYDGKNGSFGDTSVFAAVPNPDDLSAFASLRTSDGALTIMVINKVTTATPVSVKIANFTPSGPAQVFRLTAANVIQKAAAVSVTAGTLTDSEPAQSITLYVVPK
jgi:hypothetical protein